MPRKFFFVVFLFFLFLIVAAPTLAQSALPLGLQKIIAYNQQATLDFSVKISFLIAFLAGMLGILSPCILPFLPAYFSYTFKEKKNILKMTLVFFVGFSLVFVALGVVAGFLGEQSLVILQKSWLVGIAGAFMLFLGILTLLGKGFCSLFHFHQKFSNDILGVFMMGMAFALGWTACLGPILAGILGIGAVLGNTFYAGVLLFFYSLGNFVPLFLLSFFYDRFKLGERKFLQGKVFRFNLFGKVREVHSTNLLSALLFFLVGGVMLFLGGTGAVNKWDFFGTKQYFYSAQSWLLNWPYASYLAIAVFLAFLGLLVYGWKKDYGK